jgi:hypothetical protein
MNLDESRCLNHVKFTLDNLVHKFCVFITYNIFVAFYGLRRTQQRRERKPPKRVRGQKLTNMVHNFL